MAETIDAITIAYSDPASGKELVRELDKEILTRGAWTTILFRYLERANPEGEWGAVKFRVARFRKQGGVFRKQSQFNISSEDQARKMIEIITRWLDEAKS